MGERDYQPLIVSELEILRKSELANKQVFKARAYSKVINAIKALPGPVTSITDIDSVHGVGASIRAKISEIIETGILRAAEDIKADANSGVFDKLLQIYGVGPSKANALIEGGVKSLDDLKKNPSLLNDKQQIGLQYYDEFLERIPREEMKKHETYIKHIVKKLQVECKVHIVGSYRRGKESSGDIDVLIAFPGVAPYHQIHLFEQCVAGMKASKYVTDILAEGQHKCLGVCKLVRGKQTHRRIDLLLTPMQEYAYALLYFTGSDQFNIQCRLKAKEKGYSLSEHGLKPVSMQVPIVPDMTEEKEILRFLGIKYIPPSKR